MLLFQQSCPGFQFFADFQTQLNAALREEGAGFLGLKEGRAGALTVSVPEWILKLNPLSVQVFEIRTTDDLTEAWLKEKLSFFR